MRENEKKMYLLHSRLPVFKKRVEEAKRIIHEAFKTVDRWILSYSGGKDSTVLLDIVASEGFLDDILFFRYPETPNQNIQMAEWAAKAYGAELHIVDVPGAFDVYEKVGYFFIQTKTPEEKKWTNWMLKEYKRTVNRYVENGGWQGQFLGMRKLESRVRRIALSRKGEIYRTKDRKTITCVPLLNWSGRDIWAYITMHDLPYLSIYDQNLKDRERHRSEPTFLDTPIIWEQMGEGLTIKTYYPDVWEKAASRWPEINRYI